MRTSTMLLAALGLSLAACATETTYEGDVLPGPTVAKSVCRTGCGGLDREIAVREWVPLGDGVYQRANGLVPQDTVMDLCSNLPEHGLCSLACDPGAFASTLAHGSCGAAHCVVDGGELLVSACNTAN